MKFGKNMLIYASADLLGRSIGLITSPIATRLLTQEQYGVAPLLGAVWSVIALAQYAGMDWAYPFFLSQFSESDTLDKKKILVTSTWGATIGLTIIWSLFSIAAIITPFLKNYANINSLELVAYLFGLFPGALLSWYLYLLRFLHQAFPFAKITLLGKVLGVLIAFPIIAISPQQNRLFLMFSLSGFVQFFALFFGLLQFNKLEIFIYKLKYFSSDLCKEMLKYGLFLVPGGAVYSISSVADRLLVGWLSSPSEVAILSLAIALSSSILILKGWFAMVWDPHLVEWVATRDQNIYLPKLQATSIGLSSIFFILACISDIWSDWLVNLLYPASYKPTQTLIPYIVLTGAIAILSLVAVATAMIANTPKYHFPIYLIALMVNITVGLVLIPELGAYGAVIGTLSAELSILIAWIAVGSIFLKNLPINWYYPFIMAIMSLSYVHWYNPGMLSFLSLIIERILLTIVFLAILSFLLWWKSPPRGWTRVLTN